jgi:hypothetical protein
MANFGQFDTPAKIALIIITVAAISGNLTRISHSPSADKAEELSFRVAGR